MDARTAYQELIADFREKCLLDSVGAVVGWDEQTYMPPKGSSHRAEQMALVAKMSHAKLTSPRIGERLAAVEGSELVRDGETIEAVNVREIRRSYYRAVKLPSRLVEELARVTTQAQHAWREARKNRKFADFAPWLEKVVALKREEAQAVGYRESPYDALLDEYEPGATAKEITEVFAKLRAELTPLVGAIVQSGRTPKRDLLTREFPIDRQAIFGQAAAAAIGFDFAAGRLDLAVHPFCSGIGPGDCRLTTRYAVREFNQGFFGILHEAGHGIYEQGLDAQHYGTPMGTAVSLGIHESQSRLWENQVGRSRPFWEAFLPRLQQTFPGVVDDVSLDDWMLAINDVKRSFIRVEADEATYNLHIILRFELEQALISGDLAPKDAPGAWNEKFQASFDLTPPDDAQGCLQDVHWSMGGIGYFPTYTLGNLFAAQFMEQARKDLPSLDEDVRHAQFGPLKDWLNEKIHRPGQQWRPQELCRRVTGQPMSHQPLIRYLREKFGTLYGL
ncbi:MAG: carboxypeptidase M32 [Gemmataceae bacterium]|nr:carboxypeptidase M32 [Gemmataceae bacterium]